MTLNPVAVGAPFLGHVYLYFMSAFILVLPFAHTVALRLTILAILAAITVGARWRAPMPVLPLKWPLAAVAFISALSITWAVDPSLSFREFRHEIIYTFVAFFIGFVLTRSRADLFFYTRAILAGFTVMVLLGCIASTLPGRWAHFGFQGGVGTYSTYLVTVMPWALATLVLTRGLVVRVFLAILVVVAIYAGYLTENRAFFLAIFAVVMTFAALTAPLFSLPRIKKIFIGIAIIAALGGMLALFAFVIEGRGDLTADVVGGVERMFIGDVRLPFWRDSIIAMREHLWLGVGFGRPSFGVAYPELRTAEHFWHAHNTFLNRAAQTGLVGLAAFLFLLVALLRQAGAMYAHKQSLEIRVMGAAGFALLLGIVVKNFTDDFFGRELALLTWTMIGIVLGYVTRHCHSASKG